MILEKFKIKFQGKLTDDVKNILKDKTESFDFSRVAKMCIKITVSKDFLLHELNEILKEITKNVNDNLKVEMQVLVDSKYENDVKNIEVMTSDTVREWENETFLSFVEEK